MDNKEKLATLVTQGRRVMRNMAQNNRNVSLIICCVCAVISNWI